MRERVPTGGVASTGIAPLLTGQPRAGHVLGASPAAAYLVFPLDGGTPAGGLAPVPVVALEAHGSVGLPLAVGLPAADGHRLPRLRRGSPATVGNGHLAVGDLDLRVTRWRDPRPVLAPVDGHVLAARAARASSLVPAPADPLERQVVAQADDLDRAVACGDDAAARVAADAMLGLGPGSTPAGDDVLAGFVAAGRLLAAVTRGWPGPAASWFDQLGTALAAAAPRRTSALSAALLWHAGRGHVASPAGALLTALTGRGDLTLAMAGLCAVGHTSGAHLARGVLAAARVARHHDLSVRRSDPPSRAQGSHDVRTPRGPSRRLPRLRQPDAGQPAGR